MDHHHFLRPVAPITVLLLVGFSSFYFLPPSVGAAPGPDAVTTTTNQALAPMTTNKVFDTFGSCFQNQCSQPIRYLFKPNGFAAWHNVGSGNITLNSFTVGGQSRSVSAFSNSTTIDYRITVPNVVTMDIYFKEAPMNGRSSNTFKVTMIGTSSVAGTFTWNFGNPQAFPITCDNTKKVLTYGITGINFTDSVNFNAICTNTTLSFTIGVGAFRIDPTTVSTTTNNFATAFNTERKVFFCQTRFWAFYSDGSNIVFRTSLDGATWTSATTVRSAVFAKGTPFSTWTDCANTKIYYSFAPSASTFAHRAGTLNTAGTITWDYAEVAITPTHPFAFTTTITKDTSSILWIAIGSFVNPTANYVEVWDCTISGTNCGTATNWANSLTRQVNSLTTQRQIMPSIVPLTAGKLSLVYDKDNGATAMGLSTFSGSAWSSEVVLTSTYSGQIFSTIAISDTTHFAGAKSTRDILYWSCAYPCSSAPTETTISAASGTLYDDAVISSDNNKEIMIAYARPLASTSVLYKISTDGGSTFGSEQTLVSSESIGGGGATMSVTYTKGSCTCYSFLWTNFAGSNVRFQVFLTNIPGIVQSTSCTFTGSSGTCAFASNTKAQSSIVVFTGATATTTVSSITDTQLLTYSLIVASDIGTVGDDEAWWACHPSTAAADTITVNYALSVTSTIILYELHGSPTGTSCSPSSSTGSSASASTASVTSYTPRQNAFIIGALNSNCQVACTITAGSGYSKDKDVNINAVNDFTTEFFWNIATADTTPYTFSLASAYNEISVAFYDLTWKNETFAPSIAFASTFVSKISKTFGISATFTPKFNQGLNLHSFIPTAISFSPIFKQGLSLHSFPAVISFSPVFNQGGGTGGVVVVVRSLGLGTIVFIGIVVGFMLIGVMIATRRRRR